MAKRQDADAIAHRVSEHRSGKGSAFADKCPVQQLVCLEPHDDIRLAIQHEKTLKDWKRAWKIAPIEKDNPEWRDVYEDIKVGARPPIPSPDRPGDLPVPG